MYSGRLFQSFGVVRLKAQFQELLLFLFGERLEASCPTYLRYYMDVI